MPAPLEPLTLDDLRRNPALIRALREQAHLERSQAFHRLLARLVPRRRQRPRTTLQTACCC
ncbi:MAG: hypothetical protein IPK29_10295 [Betaproteobacteria bacterium]|jgi:hypothetical protein|nr:hypothetical protein [Betaproteobacteria bacterium]